MQSFHGSRLGDRMGGAYVCELNSTSLSRLCVCGACLRMYMYGTIGGGLIRSVTG